MKRVDRKGELSVGLVIDVSDSEQNGTNERDKNWLDFISFVLFFVFTKVGWINLSDESYLYISMGIELWNSILELRKRNVCKIIN